MKRRSGHLPQLSPLELEAALARLEAAPDISPEGKRIVRQMLEAAANPNAERADVVIATLDDERRAGIEATMQAVSAVFNSVTARGRAALEAMSDDEWNALMDEGE